MGEGRNSSDFGNKNKIWRCTYFGSASRKLPRVVEYKIRRESWIKLRKVGKDVHRKNNPNRTVVEF